jgi:hypothetical protein
LFVLFLCLVFLLCPVSLDCLLCFVCRTSVSYVPDISTVSRLSVVLYLSSFDVLSSLCFQCPTDNLETLETSGIQDTEGRQNIGQSRDTGYIRNTRTCVPDVSSFSRFSVVLCLSYFCVSCSCCVQCL